MRRETTLGPPRSGRTRRRFIQDGTAAVAGLGFGGSLLTACTGDDGGEDSNTLTFGAWREPVTDAIRDDFCPRFTRETGIKTRWIASDYETFFEKSLREAESGGTTYDIMILDDAWIPQFGQVGGLLNLSELGVDDPQDDDDIVPSLAGLGDWPPRPPILAPPTVRGQESELLAVSFTGDCRSLSYRTDLFDSPPETWADIVDVAEEYTDPARKRFGWVFSPAGVGASDSFISDYLFTFGGTIFDDDFRPAFNSPQGVDALAFQVSLMEYTPPGVVEFGLEQETQLVARGEAAAAVLWPFSNVTVYDPAASEVADKLAATLTPKEVRHASVIGAFIGAIPKGSKSPEAAARFIRWFTAKERQVEWARAGFMPMRISAFADEQAREKTLYLEATEQALAAGIVRPRSPEWFEVNENMAVELGKAFARRDVDGAKEYLDRAAERAFDTLDRAGYYST